MNKFFFQSTPITDLKIIKHEPIRDKRGFFDRFFCQNIFDPLMQKKNIRQINYTLTKKKGTVRGFHFQYPPYAEIKIVTCLKGKVWDVAVDLRKGSPTFFKYHSVLLTEDNLQSFFIPEGFAHGFQSLTPDCEMIYLHTAEYNQELEFGLNAIDPLLGINWPEPIIDRSERDSALKMLTKDFQGIDLT